MSKQQQKWDARYADVDYRELRLCRALSENVHLTPERGRALDLASGLGANALFLAELGLDTTAWDLSPQAISHLAKEADQRGLSIDAEARDIVESPPTENSFDLIVVAHFLERALCPMIERALSPGGLLFYQTWTQEKISDEGPTNPDFLLREGELLTFFPNLIIRAYRDDGCVGDPVKGLRNQAILVGEKRC